MKKLVLTLTAGAILASTAMASDQLTGDKKLACEAILCLPASTRPSECKPSIKKYFSIIGKKPSDTANKRKQFLNKCPADNTPQMQAIKGAIVAGAFSQITNKYCEPSHLNSQPGISKVCYVTDNECRQKKQITEKATIVFIPKNIPVLPKECEGEPLSYKCHTKRNWIECGWSIDR